ncbi:ABC transporter substrate-binding protein [Arthrobacter ginkgonis]|uniref:ABC transporter substrate-binding protein n=1 Tax=Arthrobacter ginkgonis TaxID=1630594 RepID=A0ABP7BQ05_9MICC
MVPRNLVLTSSCLAALLAVSGCASSSSAGTQQSQDLTLAVASEPVGLDPSVSANGNTSSWFVDLAYQSLISTDENGGLAPGLAEKWEFIGDGHKQLKVTLRPGLKFADGTDLRAKDVVASIEYFKKGSGPSSVYFKDLELEAASDLEVLIGSPDENPLLPTLLTPKYMGGGIISPKGLENPDALNASTFGAGPYQLDAAQTVSGDQYVYVANENYYDPEAVKFEEITIRIIPNVTSQVQALKTGQIDLMQGDVSVMSDVTGESKLSVTSSPTFWNGLYFADRDGKVSPALADERVRQALNYAIDREAIAKAAYGEYGSAESQPMVPGDPTFGYDEELAGYYAYDPEKARQLLAEAGYADGFTLSIPYKASQAPSTKMVQSIAAQLEEVGVKVTLEPGANTGEWVSKLVSLQHGAFQQDSSGRPMILATEMGWLPGGVLNPFNVDDADIQDAYDALVAAGEDPDGAKAKELMRVLVEKAITLPVAKADEIFVYDNTKLQDIDFIGDSPKLSYVYDWEPANAG